MRAWTLLQICYKADNKWGHWTVQNKSLCGAGICQALHWDIRICSSRALGLFSKHQPRDKARKRLSTCLQAGEAARLGGQRDSGYSRLQPHTWTSSHGCQQLGTTIPTAVCPILFAEDFAFLKEGSTQAWNNAENSSERKGRRETGDSQLSHSVSDPEQGSPEETRTISNTGSILKLQCNPCKFPEKKDKSALHWHTFFNKAAWSRLNVFLSMYYLTNVPVLFIAFQGT